MPQKPHISISDLLASAAHAKRQNRWDDAREFALQALELEPGHVEASWYLKAVDDVIALVMYDRPIGPQLPSALENKMLKLLTEAGFKRPRVEYPLSGYRVDFAYPDLRLAIETDGREFHGPERRWYDQNRDQNLLLDGWMTYRLRWHRVTRFPHSVVRGLIIATLRRQKLPDSEIRKRIPIILNGTGSPPTEIVADPEAFRRFLTLHPDDDPHWSVDDPFGDRRT